MSAFVIFNLKEELKKARETLLENLTQGVEKMEDYKYILGKIHMLDMCQQEVSRLLEKEENFDD